MNIDVFLVILFWFILTIFWFINSNITNFYNSHNSLNLFHNKQYVKLIKSNSNFWETLQN